MPLPLDYINTALSGDTLSQGLNKVNLAIQFLNEASFQNASNLTSGAIPSARITSVDFAAVAGTATTPLMIDADSATYLLRLASDSATAGHRVLLRFANHPTLGTAGAGIGLALNTTSFTPSGMTCGVGDLFIYTLSGAAGNSNAIRFCTPSDDASAYAERMRIAKDGSINVAAGSSLFFESTVRQMLNLYGTSYGIGIQSGTLFFRTNSTVSWHVGGSFSASANDPGVGGVEIARLCPGGHPSGAGLHLNPGSAAGTDAWFRSYGNTGWYNQTYSGGWHMIDTTFVRSYNAKSVMINKNWDGYWGNLHIAGNAPSITFWDNDHGVKWLVHCNSDRILFYRAISQSEAGADWVQKFIVASDGNIWWGYGNGWLSQYLNQAVLTTSSPTFSRLISGVGYNPNFSTNDGSGCIEARSYDASGCANIVFHRPGAFAAKFGINTAGQFEWGGWSMYPARMTLDGSGNLTIPGTITANNINLTGGSMSPIKSIRRAYLAGTYNTNLQTITLSPPVDVTKTVLFYNSDSFSTTYLTYAYLESPTTIKYRFYAPQYSAFSYQLVEYV
jgi:hypothetical protein